MVKWSEEQIKQVVDSMRKGVSLRTLYETIKPSMSDKYGFHDLDIGGKSKLYPVDLLKNITSRQTTIHRRTQKRFSVNKVGEQLQITRKA